MVMTNIMCSTLQSNNRTFLVSKQLAAIVLGALLLLPLKVLAAELKAEVDRSTIALNDTFRLVLSYSKSTLSGRPDVSQLEDHFAILGQSTQSMTNIVNGRLSATTQWHFSLAPKQTGSLLIPSFEFDGAFSEAIEITVTNAQQGSAASGSDVFVDTNLDKGELYVQEQLIVTTRLYTSIRLISLDVQPLEIPDTQIVKLDELQYQRKVNGKDYVVAEVSYAVFPQKSGVMTVPALTWSVSTPATRGYGLNSITRSNAKRYIAESQEVTVKPAPANTSGLWLPAKHLKLDQHWSDPTDVVTAGEPITRTISIKGDGIMAIQLPALDVAAPNGIRLYPDQPQTDEVQAASGITSELSQSFAVVAEREGTYNLPALEIHWWNTETNSPEVATLPEETITVLAAASNNTTAPEKSDRQKEVEAVFEQALNEQADQESAVEKAESSTNPFWVWLAIFSIIVNVILALLLFLLSQKKPIGTAPNLSPLEPAKHNSKLLKKAINESDAQELRKQLLLWGRDHFKGSSITRLDQLATEISDTQFSDFVKRLDATLYNSSESTSFSLSEQETKYLLDLIKGDSAKANSQSSKENLRPLYQ